MSDSDSSIERMGAKEQNVVDPNSLLANAQLSNSMSPTDPANPHNWPMVDKIITSWQAWVYSATAAVGLTCFSTATAPFATHFGLTAVPPETVISTFSLYFFGVAFAPMWTPHVTERIGRSTFFFFTTGIAALFHIGAGFGRSLETVQTCRFFAGLFAGPCLLIVEGSYAELWSAEYTNTYYAIQGTGAFVGAGIGPICGSYLVSATGNWRWTEWFPAALSLTAMLIGLGMKETYHREIVRRQGVASGKTRSQVIVEQPPPLSGNTLWDMFNVTWIQPTVLFFTQPIVTCVTYTLVLTWALLIQWFYSAPVALGGAGFSLRQIGLAFLVTVAGTGCAAICVIAIELVSIRINRRKIAQDPRAIFGSIEYRVLPAIPGTMFIFASLFWVGNTITPTVNPVVPIIGVGVYIWGASMVTFSLIPYLYDTFEPTTTLSAITSQAVGRVVAGAVLPFLILIDIINVGGPKWGLGLFGFISLTIIPIPFFLFFYGTNIRANSKYAMTS